MTVPSLPVGGGDHLLEGINETGEALFSLAFQPLPVPDAGAGEGHFAFAVPLRGFDERRLAGLRLSGGGHRPVTREAPPDPELAVAPEPVVTPVGPHGVEIRWDSALHPMALIRDPATGQVLSLARGGWVRLEAPADELELVFSNGVRGSRPVRKTVR
jgi:hypothetical protein